MKVNVIHLPHADMSNNATVFITGEKLKEHPWLNAATSDWVNDRGIRIMSLKDLEELGMATPCSGFDLVPIYEEGGLRCNGVVEVNFNEK